jgi:hypothetical protein
MVRHNARVHLYDSHHTDNHSTGVVCGKCVRDKGGKKILKKLNKN